MEDLMFPCKRILVVEDSAIIRSYVRRILEKAMPEWAVVEAADGPQALDEIHRQNVDLIMTDYEMPLMDGDVLVGIIRQETRLKRRPVILFSARSLHELKEKFKDDPFVTILMKPATPDQILRSIAFCFGINPTNTLESNQYLKPRELELSSKK
jgi:two-component system chemotaxis response regulator CheY